MAELPSAEPVLGREQLVAALASLPDELERALANQPPEALVRPGRDGGWGVIENLCHLRDWEEIFVDRAKAVVSRDRPLLPAYDDELWPIERDYRAQDPARVMQDLRELRAQLVALLRERPEEDWGRVGVHAVHGDVTLRWLADRARRHGDEHLFQISEALA